MIQNITEICEKLQSNDRRAKISTLEHLQEKCLDIKETSDAEVLQIFDDTYLHLLKCYSDRYESVRDKAIQTVTMFIERLPANDFHLVNIVSTYVDRMGKAETVEESEEIRLLLIDQLLTLVNRFITTGNKCSLHDCYKEIFQVILKALKDPYPSVQRQACSCVIAIASTADTFVLRPIADHLAKGLYGMLNHKHSQARIIAIKSLGYVALHIDANGDALSQLLMEVSPLLMDSMPLVRRECGELGARLLLELRDRYSYFERLIPFVLCCLKDDSSEVQSYILPLWEKCGKLYYEENEVELSKKEIADIKPKTYPSNVTRPTIGCRAIVQRSLRVLKLIMRESNDWKENVRLHSLKLLYQFVLHAEAAMTAQFFEIYGDIAKALRDVEPSVVQEAAKVSDLMGRLLNYDDWFEHGFEGLEKHAKEGYLKCFYYMYTASVGAKKEHNLRLSKLIKEPEFSQTLNYNVQLYNLKIIETILYKHEAEENKDSVEIYRNCYCATIKVLALSLEIEPIKGDELQNKASIVLQKLCEFCKCNNDDLHEQFFAYALDYVENIDAPLDALSEPILLLYGLINLAKFRAPYLKQLQEKISIVFEHCADESKIKILSAVSVAMLDWNKTIRRDISDSCDLLRNFLSEVVEPNVVWKAGANAEAMRSLATATLCAASQGATEEAKIVLPNFAKHMAALLEDQTVSTRHYAIKALANFGEIEVEQLRPIAYGCLQRLNDPSSGIRVLAASVIPKLQVRFEKDTNDKNKENKDNEIWAAFMKNCFDMLYLHYDNPEERLQVVIKDTIIQLSKQYPEISKDAYERALVASLDCYNLKELKSVLPIV